MNYVKVKGRDALDMANNICCDLWSITKYEHKNRVLVIQAYKQQTEGIAFLAFYDVEHFCLSNEWNAPVEYLIEEHNTIKIISDNIEYTIVALAVEGLFCELDN